MAFRQKIKLQKLLDRSSNVVGTLHTAGALRGMARPPAGVQAMEARLDALPGADWARLLPEAAVPVILTPRAREEGGALDWSVAERTALTFPLLPWATAVDLELSQHEQFTELTKAMRRERVGLILSSHDFAQTPPARVLQKQRDKAIEAGADIFKVATWLRRPQDLSPLLDLLTEPSPLPVAVMGMGPWGSASRIYLARAGSVLNYGWLHRPQVPGQLPAARLARILTDLERTK